MRIAYYSPFLTSCTGPGVHARALVDAWRRDGHEVLCLPREPEGDGTHVGAATAGTDRLPPSLRYAGSIGKAALRYLADYSKVRTSLTAFSPDLVVARRNLHDWILDRLVVSEGMRYVAEVNAVFWLERQEVHGLHTRPSEVERETRFLLRASRCACVSQEWARVLIGLGVHDSRVVVVPNGVDATLFSPDVRRSSRLEALTADWSPVMAFVGTGSATHDLVTMARAADDVVAALPTAGFVFVGTSRRFLADNGFSSRTLARSIAVDSVKHSEVPSWLASADLLWAAFSASTGSALKVMEYMAMAKPVVAACAGQIADDIRDARCGSAVPLGDASALAREIRRIAALPEDSRRSLGIHGRTWVVRNRDWAVVASTMIDGLEPEAAGRLAAQGDV